MRLPSNSTLKISRRTLLTGAAGLAGSLAVGRPAAVFAQAAATVPPYSFRQGGFEITMVSDGSLLLPTDVVGPEVSKAPREAFLGSIGQDLKEFRTATNLPLVRTGTDLILFDTGSGAGFQPSAGKIGDDLRAAGVEPSAITKVVFTHGHPDHIWGTMLDGGALRFPNAAYYSGAAEWDFWNDKDLVSKMPKEMEGFVRGAQAHYGAVKSRVSMLKPGDEVVTGVRALDSAGHTPGHLSFEVAGGDGLIVVGDAIPSAAIYFPNPGWTFAFDAVPDLAVAARRKLLDRAATDKVQLVGYHWPYPGVGFAERKDGAFRYVPA